MPFTHKTELIENFTYDEITIGQSARLMRTLSLADIQAFAAVSGDTNPSHLDAKYANDSLFHGVVAHGMWGGALISGLLGTEFPGPGTIYKDQTLHFTKEVRVGDTLTVTVTVMSKDDISKSLKLDCQVINQKGETVLQGLAQVLAPTQKMRQPRVNAPKIQLFDPKARFADLLAKGAGLDPVRCAVVHPCDPGSLSGAIDSARHGLILPVLIGPETRIRFAAEEAGIDLTGVEIISVEHSHAAAEKAADMAARGEVEILMEKVDIVQNAIDFARIMGVQTPKVAILSAVETVNANIPSTIDAAALCKMADRGQITGGVLDGPLAFDNAISAHAARIKHIESAVAGDADILAVPDLESGNMLAKQLEYLAGASGSGLVLGARVPIALTSRAEGPMNRVASALLALLAAHNARAVNPLKFGKE